MQRRRLSSLAKVSLHVMHSCAQNLDDFQVVYASRHGELIRTTDLLNQLAQGESVSPMGFSLAVLNATAGVYSIARNNRAACSAVSAGANTFAMGWLEAAVQARTAQHPVLFVYADAPTPEVYGADAQTTGPLHAIAMLLHSEPGEGRQSVCCSWSGAGSEPSPAQASIALSPSLAFARHWSTGSDGGWSSGTQTLSWSFA